MREGANEVGSSPSSVGCLARVECLRARRGFILTYGMQASFDLHGWY